MSKDFRASQVETSKLIASGGIAGTTAGLVIYSGSITSNRQGGTTDSVMLSNVGTDVFMFVSGAIAVGDQNEFNRSEITLFGGDVVISGTLYAERQVIEVDQSVPGNFFVTGNMFVEPDSNSTKAVAFRKADGTDILIVDSTNSRVGIGVTDPDSTLEILSTSTQLKLSNNSDDYSTFSVGTNGALTVETVDAAGGSAHFVVAADGAVDIDANIGALSLDGATGINIGTETDVAIDIDSSTLDIDASGAITIDGTSTLSLDAADSTNLTMAANAASTKTMTISATNANGSNVSNIDVDADGALTLNGAGSATFGDDTEAIAYDGSGNVDFDAVALDIDASGAITIDGTSTLSLDVAGAINIDSTGGAINIGVTNHNQNINIGTDGTRTIQVGAGDGTSTTTINSRAGTLTLDGTGQTVDINSAALDIDASGAITVDGSSTLSLDTSGDTNLTTTGGVLTLQSGKTGASALLLTASHAAGGITLEAGTGDLVLNSDAKIELTGSSGADSVHVLSDMTVAGALFVTEHIKCTTDDNTFIRFNGSDTIQFRAGGVTMVQITESTQDVYIHNPDNNDVDFQVNTDNAYGTFFVDGADDTVIIGHEGFDTTPTASEVDGYDPDVKILLSGTVGSKGTSTRGVTLISGDATVSGSLDINTVKITSDGKIGIGTTSPSHKLEVGGNASFGEYLYHRGDTDTFIQFADDAIGISAGNEQLVTISQVDAGQDIVKIGDGGDVDFQVRTNGDDNTLYVEGATDRVGIGTNSPVSILHVKESAPTLSMQRENNGNDSTIAFLGSGGNTGAIMHLSSSNDLVFKTHDGSSPHEILRLGGHQASDVRQIIMLSGSDMHAGAMHPKEQTDINFFVSGAISSKGTTTRGTAVFGGDVVISGTLHQSSLSLNDLSDVDLTVSPSDTSILVYDSTASAFERQILSGDVSMTREGVVTVVSASSAAKIDTTSTNPVATYYIPFVENSTSTQGDELHVSSNITVTQAGAFTAVGVTGTGNVNVGASLVHNGDTDTKIAFTEDRIKIEAGSVEFFDILESTSGQDSVTFNQAGVDIDFFMESSNLQSAFLLDSANDQLLLMCNVDDPIKERDAEGIPPDVNLFVSGSAGSKDSSIKGTTLFNGDVAISGSLYTYGHTRHVQATVALRSDDTNFVEDADILIRPTDVLINEGSGWVTDKFQAPVDGLYAVTATVALHQLDSASGGYKIFLSGSDTNTMIPKVVTLDSISDSSLSSDTAIIGSGAASYTLNGTTFIRMAKDDFFQLYVRQVAGTQQTDILGNSVSDINNNILNGTYISVVKMT